MNKDETQNILTILRVNYPNNFKSVANKKDMNLIVNTWGLQFKDYTFDDVYKAIMSIMANDTSGFAPSIGRIKEELNKKYKESVRLCRILKSSISDSNWMKQSKK